MSVFTFLLVCFLLSDEKNRERTAGENKKEKMRSKAIPVYHVFPLSDRPPVGLRVSPRIVMYVRYSVHQRIWGGCPQSSLRRRCPIVVMESWFLRVSRPIGRHAPVRQPPRQVESAKQSAGGKQH